MAVHTVISLCSWHILGLLFGRQIRSYSGAQLSKLGINDRNLNTSEQPRAVDLPMIDSVVAPLSKHKDAARSVRYRLNALKLRSLQSLSVTMHTRPTGRSRRSCSFRLLAAWHRVEAEVVAGEGAEFARAPLLLHALLVLRPREAGDLDVRGGAVPRCQRRGLELLFPCFGPAQPTCVIAASLTGMANPPDQVAT